MKKTKKAQITNHDVLRVVVSDFHSGSNYALFPNRIWEGKHTSHAPRSIQIAIRKQFERFADAVLEAREGKTVELIHNGDAIDGDHHHSGDVCTVNTDEQADLHIELMSELQKRIGWRRGDKIYYTRGTQVHVNEKENYIGREMNAVPNGDFFCWDFLELKTNGVTSWFVHHGPSRGNGANEGNPVKSWLKNVYYDALNDKTPAPDIVYTGHVHNPTYNVHVYREKMDFRMMHGVIIPSWQAKTTYALMKAPVSKNKIGGVWHDIKADGTITIPKFSVMET